jgi:hypothetical protein
MPKMSFRQREALNALTPDGRTLAVNLSSGSFGGYIHEGAHSIGLYVTASTVTSLQGRGWIDVERTEETQHREYTRITHYYRITDTGRAAL